MKKNRTVRNKFENKVNLTPSGSSGVKPLISILQGYSNLLLVILWSEFFLKFWACKGISLIFKVLPTC